MRGGCGGRRKRKGESRKEALFSFTPFLFSSSSFWLFFRPRGQASGLRSEPTRDSTKVGKALTDYEKHNAEWISAFFKKKTEKQYFIHDNFFVKLVTLGKAGAADPNLQ